MILTPRKSNSWLRMMVCLMIGSWSFAQAQPADSHATAGEEEGGSYTPGQGFKVASSDQGDMRIKVYSYVRYLNQHDLDPTFANSFGDTISIDRRQDVQLNKVNVQFLGWLMDPRFRYFFYVWTNNTAQGQGAQVVVAGNLTYKVGDHLTLGGGVNALPGVRTTEGNYPFWLTVDNRTMADEFFRPSYTMGFWASGQVYNRLNYDAMIGNNLSQLGVDAGQLDEDFSTLSAGLSWYPTTGEFGARAGYGDFDEHDKVATRVGAHFTRSPENRQGQPNTEAFENVQIRLSDGSVIFAPDLFGAGVQIDDAIYHMSCIDAGAKWRGFAFEAEYYWRWVNGFEGPGTSTLGFDVLLDRGFQLLASSMLVPQTFQLYLVGSQVFGDYGNPSEFRGGANYFPWKNQVVRCNVEYIHLNRCPVGGLSLPYPVGGNGNLLNVNFQVDF